MGCLSLEISQYFFFTHFARQAMNYNKLSVSENTPVPVWFTQDRDGSKFRLARLELALTLTFKISFKYFTGICMPKKSVSTNKSLFEGAIN